MTTNDKGEIAQSDRGRLRTLAQKRRVQKRNGARSCSNSSLRVIARTDRRETVREPRDRSARSRKSDRRARARCARSLRPSASDAADKGVARGRCALQLCDLKAVEPLLKIVGLLDRYHALAAAASTNRRAVEPRRLSRSVAPLALTHAAPGLELSRVTAEKVAEPIVNSFEPRRLGRRDRGARGGKTESPGNGAATS